MREKTKVIYIVGEGRSGSTLLERILGQHPKVFAAGELKHIWERSFLENQLCSCNKSFNECEVWGNVRDLLADKNQDLNYQKMIEFLEKTSRIRHYLFGKDLDNKYVKYINDIYTSLYDNILETTGKELVIDASKHPVFAHILAQNDKIDLYVIHLVRDVRGVAYSWTKKRIRPEITNKEEYMPRYSPLRTAISWDIINKIAEDLKNKKIKYQLLRYEDLIANPKKSLDKIYELLGIKDNFSKLFVNDDTIILSKNHTVSGNPMRFKTGKIKLTLDEKWKTDIDTKTKLIVTLFTYPYLKKYKYSN